MANNTMVGNIYYLQGDTHQELHQTVCCCIINDEKPHRAIGASLYLLDSEGLHLLYEATVKQRPEPFADWLRTQEADTTIYSQSERSACNAAAAEALHNGDLVVNAPERYPWLGFVLDAFSDEIETPDPDDNLGGAKCWCESTPASFARCPICRDRVVAIMHHYL